MTDSRGIASTRAHNSSPEGAGGCAGWCAPLARSGCARLPRGSLRPPRRPTSALCSLSHPPLSPPWPPPPLVSAWPSPGGNEQVEHVWDVWRRIRRLRWPAELATEAVGVGAAAETMEVESVEAVDVWAVMATMAGAVGAVVEVGAMEVVKVAAAEPAEVGAVVVTEVGAVEAVMAGAVEAMKGVFNSVTFRPRGYGAEFVNFCEFLILPVRRMDGAPSGQAEQFPLTSVGTLFLERLGNRTEDLCIFKSSP